MFNRLRFDIIVIEIITESTVRYGMPALANTRHELFCQNLTKGMSEVAAYEAAGYARDPGNACHLGQQPHIRARVQELMEKAGKRAEITAARVLEEMAKLAFHNPAHYLKIEDDGSAIVDLSKLDRDQAAAITEVISERGEDGRVKTRIKLADKKAALVELGRHFGLWIDRTEQGQPGDFSRVQSTEELIERIRAELGSDDAEALISLAMKSAGTVN
jgi:phage terminase small subunit